RDAPRPRYPPHREGAAEEPARHGQAERSISGVLEHPVQEGAARAHEIRGDVSEDKVSEAGAIALDPGEPPRQEERRPDRDEEHRSVAVDGLARGEAEQHGVHGWPCEDSAIVQAMFTAMRTAQEAPATKFGFCS